MEYRTLGRSGLKVSAGWLGTANFGPGGGPAGCDDAEAGRIVAAFLDAGHNVIDTGGDPEEMVGRALRGRRDAVVLATKAFPPPAAEPSATLDGFVRSGKVRYLGACNLTAAEVVEAGWAAQRGNAVPLISLQSQYSLLARGIEAEILPACDRHGLGVAAWSPLAGGVLTGRYRDGATPHPDSRIGRMLAAPDPRVHTMVDRLLDGRNADLIDELVRTAAELGTSPVAVAIAWIRQRPGVTSVIIGPRAVGHLDANLRGLSLDLPPETAKRLDDLSWSPALVPVTGVGLTALARR